MKKIALKILIIIMIICSGLYIYFGIALSGNRVISYGKSKTLSEIIKLDERKINTSCKKYSTGCKNLNDWKYKRAMVKSLGSTRHFSYNIDNNDIIVIGNRNLVKINNKLYIYIENK